MKKEIIKILTSLVLFLIALLIPIDNQIIKIAIYVIAYLVVGFEVLKEAIENIKKVGAEEKINVIIGDAVEVLPTLHNKYDVVFIDAAKGKYPFFLEQALRLINKDGIIIADNVLYKGYVLGDYNKHKQRTAVRNLREYISKITNDPNIETQILEVGDGIAISRII